MTALVVVLLLAAGAENAPLPSDATPPEADATGAAAPALEGRAAGRSWPRRFRGGGGATAIADVTGVAPGAEVGLELDPWELVGFRMTFGTAMRVGWGSFFATPEVVLRGAPMQASFAPYLAAGVQVAAVNITPRALGVSESTGAIRSGLTSDEGAADPRSGASADGPSPLSLSLGPQVGAGLELQLSPQVTVDLGVRYTLLTWNGDRYHAVSGTVMLCGPLHF